MIIHFEEAVKSARGSGGENYGDLSLPLRRELERIARLEDRPIEWVRMEVEKIMHEEKKQSPAKGVNKKDENENLIILSEERMKRAGGREL